MRNPRQMISGLTRIVDSTMDINPNSIISVCAAGRPSVYLVTLAMLMGLHVRLGMEDTVWRYPHRDELVSSNLQQLEAVKAIAENLGRYPMCPAPATVKSWVWVRQVTDPCQGPQGEGDRAVPGCMDNRKPLPVGVFPCCDREYHYLALDEGVDDAMRTSQPSRAFALQGPQELFPEAWLVVQAFDNLPGFSRKQRG